MAEPGRSPAPPALSEAGLFGWDETPGIVSVSADRHGRALVWQRLDGQVTYTHERFRPWILAATLEDVAHLGPALAPNGPALARASVTYQELAGVPGSLRFLLSAPSERQLERAICAGATHRLGQSVTGLWSLEDYYRVGPIEQYLMQSGRSYFRGLRYADLHRLQFDLETTALTPEEGRIFLIAVRDSHGLEQILEAPHPDDEAQMIAALCALIRERDPDVLENHNLLGFDLPFLHGRATQLHVPLRLGRHPGSPILQHHPVERGQRFRIAGRELVDTLDAVRRHDFVVRDLPSHGLKAVARAFGVARSERVYLPGSAVAATYAHDPETVRRYALDDVAEVDALSTRLLGPAFALAGMAPRPYERLVTAGPAMGILEPLLVRAYLRRGAALPGPGESRTGGAHAGGGAYLFATGVAVQVVKADVASLYPSLMRLYGIGPRSDRLGVMLALVGELTDLRLAHKAAARAAEPEQAGYHQAMQAAMKLIINSAYGYLGAGAMALFGDPLAADEVTRRGRELLDSVVEALRARGVALIEADTDGVYFAVPVGWTEAKERALVAEVAATLPTGLALEYEGRYQAMFSHEVKNYALLGYDGTLTRRGVALRSSRAEAFGERFLDAALRCLLTGDVPGIRAAFLAMVDALRARTVPLQEVTTRVRLTKEPATYQRTRSRQREAGYEALLAAGRTTWRTGERVRLYHRADGQVVWLPEGEQEGEEGSAMPQADYDSEYYVRLLKSSYAARLAKAFDPADMERLFRLDAQLGLFDRPLDEIEPRWIRCAPHGG